MTSTQLLPNLRFIFLDIPASLRMGHFSYAQIINEPLGALGLLADQVPLHRPWGMTFDAKRRCTRRWASHHNLMLLSDLMPT